MDHSELGMQQLVWSETIVTGGARIRLRLPKPFARLDHYKEVAVVACPTLPGEAPLEQFVVHATAGDDAIDVHNWRARREWISDPHRAGRQARSCSSSGR